MFDRKKSDQFDEDKDYGLGEDITDEEIGEKGGQSEENDEEDKEDTL